MQHRRRIVVLAAIAAMFSLGTAWLDAQTLAQERVYRLVSADGQPLPIAAGEEDGCREEVTGAALTLADSTTWRLEIAERETCGSVIEEATETEEGTYTTKGDTLRFAEAEDDEASDPDDDEDVEAEKDDDELDLDDFEVGTPNADGLTIRLEGGRTPLFRPQAG